jgi:hypothetical protein
MASHALRPRGVGEILDLGFQLYRRHWLPMVTATLVVLLPILVLEAVGPMMMLPILELLARVFFMAASAAVVVIASGAYLGREVSAGHAIRQVGRRFLSVLGAAVFQSLLILLGLLLLIVPGIIAMAYTFAMQQAVMIEGCSTDDAFQRSRELARGHLRPVLLTSVLAIVITLLAGMGIDEVMRWLIPPGRMYPVLVNLSLVALNPLVASITTVLYYDLRIRKEAFDVAVATERLEPVPAL